MEIKNKIILIVLTIFLDVFVLIAIYKSTNLPFFDLFYAVSILAIHVIFIIALIYGNQSILDILHYSIFIYIGLSIFLSNLFLIGANLLLVCVIQILWINKGCCILNDFEKPLEFGYGDELSYMMLFYTVYLANKLPILDFSWCNSFNIFGKLKNLSGEKICDNPEK